MKKAWLYIRSTPSSPPAAQRDAIRDYLEFNRITLVGEEIERSGTKGFPAFERLLEKAGKESIIISAAKHVFGSLAFLGLLEKAHDFVALNYPECRPDTLADIQSKVRARFERQSKQMKKTLQIKKSKGIKLGATRPGAEHVPPIFIQNIAKGQKLAAKLKASKAKEYYADILSRIIDLRRQGFGDQEIANELNDADLTMQNGNLFHQVSVFRLAQRIDKQSRGAGRRGLSRADYKIKFPLQAGPYEPPRIAIGDTVIDHFTDKAVEVADKQNGWPARKNGSLILTGDLVLAALRESTNSICSHWNVSPKTVRAWKEKLAGQSRDIQPLLTQKLEEVKMNADTWAIR